MKNLILASLLLLSFKTFAWGQTGHRVVGQIAQSHLTEKAQHKVKEILGAETLAQVSTWPDEIKTGTQWKDTIPWHYLSIPKGQTIDKAKRPTEGDVLFAIDKFTNVLKDSKSSKEEKTNALKFLVHFVGDIHQPLHVGRMEDEGGNKIDVKYFFYKANLHKVWDEYLINQEELSFTEYASFIDHASKEEIALWQKSAALDWYKESFEIRNEIYTDIEGMKKRELSYPYVSKYIPVVHKRLLQGGVRLAGLLNTLFI